MKPFKFHTVTKLAATGLLVLAGSAQAHTGHDTSSLFSGLGHPLGLDHMLAMLAVGLWSVRVLPAQRAWQGPALFMLALVAGAVMGMLGMQFALLEQLIALSVVLFGAMLMMSVHKVPAVLGWAWSLFRRWPTAWPMVPKHPPVDLPPTHWASLSPRQCCISVESPQAWACRNSWRAKRVRW